jgi:hypothetical protein
MPPPEQDIIATIAMQVSLGFVALVFITSTVYLYYQNYKLFQNPQKTMGKIIGITTDKTGISKDTIFSDKVVIKDMALQFLHLFFLILTCKGWSI